MDDPTGLRLIYRSWAACGPSERGTALPYTLSGVFDRMEIWDRETFDRYDQAFAGAYTAGTLAPTRRTEP